MAKKREIAHTVYDPTLETTEMTIRGKKFTLCFDFGALAEAERHFMIEGAQVDLMDALPQRSLWGSKIIFACAAHRFQPELSFEELKEFVSTPVSYAIWPFVNLAWRKAVESEREAEGEKPSKQDPAQP
jgi:hypothetical protein